MKLLVLIGIWVCAVTAGMLLAGSPTLRSHGGQDLMALVFGESRGVLSKKLVEKADLYYHGGVGWQGECPGLHDPAPAADGLALLHSTQEPHADGHEHEDEHEDGHAHAGHAPASFDWWTIINEHRHPHGHLHLHGERYEKEVLPWVWMAAKSDPGNTLAYNVGGYWLAKRLNRPEKALELLRDGIAHNPDDFELELTRGSVLRDMPGRDAEAREALEAARRKWLAWELSRTDTPALTAE